MWVRVITAHRPVVRLIAKSTKCLLLAGRTPTPRCNSIFCLTQISQQRLWSDDTKKETDIVSSFVDEMKKGEGVLASQLSVWLHCSLEEAIIICRTVPETGQVSVDKLREYVMFLQNGGLTSSLIVANPWLLAYNWSRMRPRIDLLNRVGIDETTAPLLKIAPRLLSEVTNNLIADRVSLRLPGSRLEFLAQQLRTTPCEVANMSARHPYLLTFHLDRIQRMLKMLLDSGVTIEDIRSDPWLFRIPEKQAESRIQRAKDAGVFALKIWMLRCADAVFTDLINGWRNHRDILGDHGDTVGFLAHRLCITRDEVELLVNRNCNLLHTNLPKLNGVIDLLYSYGYTSTDICHMPRVFDYKLVTLQRRLREMNAVGYKPRNLDGLCLSTKRYKGRLARLAAANNWTTEELNDVLKSINAESSSQNSP